MIKSILHISDSTMDEEYDLHRELFDIKASLSQKNKRNDITGFLAYKNGVFFQVLQGEPTKVDELIGCVEKDVRNKNFKVLINQNVSKKIYDDWNFTMKSSVKQGEQLNSFLLEHVDILPFIDEKDLISLEQFTDTMFD